VSLQIVKDKVERKHFATDAVSFGAKEQQNRGVIELLATCILLCVEVQQTSPCQLLDLTERNVKCVARHLVADKATSAITQTCLPEGVHFNNLPLQTEKDYFVIRQLGCGEHGVSCFACSESCAPCVMKFFCKQLDTQETFPDATEEANWWHHLHGDLGFNKDVVKVYKVPRSFLVLPFLRIPCNFVERQKLIEGGKDESLLHKALKHLASKNCSHHEVFWHHIGPVGKSAPTGSNSTGLGINMSFGRGKKSKQAEEDLKETAVFCDLAHVQKCEDKEELRKWVEDSSQRMKGRIGKAENNQPQVC